jgi:hypothetical protein
MVAQEQYQDEQLTVEIEVRNSQAQILRCNVVTTAALGTSSDQYQQFGQQRTGGR